MLETDCKKFRLFRQWRSQQPTRQTAHKKPHEQEIIAFSTVNRDVAILRNVINVARIENREIPEPVGFEIKSEKSRYRKV